MTKQYKFTFKISVSVLKIKELEVGVQEVVSMWLYTEFSIKLSAYVL
jgi:hypothetical protein